MNKPSISIILPTFNRANTINNAIESILNQTFNSLEIIIIDDASTDNTYQIVKEYQKKESRIIYVKNKENYGCAQSRNIGLKYVQAETVAFMDDDDQYTDKETLTCLYSKMKSECCDLVIANYKMGDELKLMDSFGEDFKYKIIKSPGPFLQCVLIKKKLIIKTAIAFDSKAIPSEDWEFFITISKLNPIVSYCACTTFKWNLNPNSQSLDFLKEANALAYICKKHQNYITTNLNSKIMSAHYRRIARVYEKACTVSQVNAFYKKAFKQYPLSIKNIFYWVMVSIGYQNTKPLIHWVRKFRGLPNA